MSTLNYEITVRKKYTTFDYVLFLNVVLCSVVCGYTAQYPNGVQLLVSNWTQMQEHVDDSKTPNVQTIFRDYPVSLVLLVQGWNMMAFVCSFFCYIMDSERNFENSVWWYYLKFAFPVAFLIFITNYMWELVLSHGTHSFLVGSILVVYCVSGGWQLHLQKQDNDTRKYWAFRKSIMFWPLYGMSLVATGLIQNLYGFNGDYMFNTAMIFVYVAVTVALWGQDLFHDVSSTLEEQQFPQFHPTTIFSVDNVWPYVLSTIIAMRVISTSNVVFMDVSNQSNTYDVMWMAAALNVLLVVVENPLIKDGIDTITTNTDEDNDLSRLTDEWNKRRMALELCVRLLVTVAVALDIEVLK